MKVYDDPLASGGKYIGTTEDVGNSGTNPRAPAGTATYTLTVADGTYKILGRVIAPAGVDDSFWLRIQGATTNTKNHHSGWVTWNEIDLGHSWHWDEVHSHDDQGQTVHFTLAAGTHTLEIAWREDGTLLDALVITDDLDLDQTTLSDVIPQAIAER
jgi:hypothetical protein